MSIAITSFDVIEDKNNLLTTGEVTIDERFVYCAFVDNAYDTEEIELILDQHKIPYVVILATGRTTDEGARNRSASGYCILTDPKHFDQILVASILSGVEENEGAYDLNEEDYYIIDEDVRNEVGSADSYYFDESH